MAPFGKQQEISTFFSTKIRVVVQEAAGTLFIEDGVVSKDLQTVPTSIVGFRPMHSSRACPQTTVISPSRPSLETNKHAPYSSPPRPPISSAPSVLSVSTVPVP